MGASHTLLVQEEEVEKNTSGKMKKKLKKKTSGHLRSFPMQSKKDILPPVAQ